MIISVNWLRELVDLGDIDAYELAKIIGARLVEVEGVVDLSEKYDGIVVAEIKKAEKIPDTKLSLCQIDVGRDELAQVVCAAPNVRVGLLSAWIPPGMVVPSTFDDDEPFVIGAKKLRGHMSEGMLAGTDELCLSDEHKAIIDFSNYLEAKPGMSVAKMLGLDDYLLDIENKSLTHRPDCFGVVGFAREVAGILGKKFEGIAEHAPLQQTQNSHQSVVGVDTRLPNHLPKSSKQDISVDIMVENRELCQAYRAVVMGAESDEATEESSAQTNPMAIKLVKSGMRPISQSVDISNYIMLLTGQPLHFFDYDKLLKVGKTDTAKIVVRSAKNGEKMELLDGKTIEMTTGDIVICSGEVPVALAGVMGGSSTAVDSGTKRILIEAATFNLYSIRSTGMRYGIFSEALTRFTKGQPAELSKYVIDDAATMLKDECGMEVLSKVYENAEKFEPIKLTVDIKEINRILGTEFSYLEVEKTLQNVGFGISCACGKKDKCECENIIVEVPYWRTDIHILEDIAEEVGRLNGYDNIPLVLPNRFMKQVDADKLGDFKQQLRGVLAGLGASEVLTYSFVSGKLITRAGQNPENSYRVVNSISPELQYYRQSLLPSLAEKAYANVKMAYDRFGLFEINRISDKSMGLNEENVPVEEDRVAMVITDRKSNEWQSGEAFYAIKACAMRVLEGLMIDTTKVALEEIDDGAISDSLDPRRAVALVYDGQKIGYAGEFDGDMKRELKLPNFVAGFEMNINKLMEISKKPREVSMGDMFDFDISVKVAKSVKFADIEKAIREKLDEAAGFYKLEALDIYNNDESSKTCSFRMNIGSLGKALTKEKALDIMKEVGGAVEAIGGQII